MCSGTSSSTTDAAPPRRPPDGAGQGRKYKDFMPTQSVSRPRNAPGRLPSVRRALEEIMGDYRGERP